MSQLDRTQNPGLQRRAPTPPDILIAELVRALTVEHVDADHFLGPLANEHWPRVFGGQLLAQALAAAMQTVPDDRVPHSLHAYFLRAGHSRSRIEYDVTRDRDGGSFAARRVVARQDNAPIFTLSASFQRRELGFRHQTDMPAVPPPEGLRSETDIRWEQAQAMQLTKRGFSLRDMPLELRPVTPRDFANPAPRPALQHFWLKPVAPLPQDAALRRAVLAYASDMMLLSTALLPHGVHWATSDIQNASLDHSLWLHADADFDDWMLYSIDSPWAGGARGLSRGAFYNRNGQLVATVAQEGLLRPR